MALNGIMADHPADIYYDMMIGIAQKRMDKAGMAAIFRQQLER